MWLHLQNQAMYNIQQTVQNSMVNVHSEYIACQDHKRKVKKTMTSKTIHCNTFKAYLFMKRTRPSLYTSHNDLSNNVKCLLENGQTRETITHTVEAARNYIILCKGHGATWQVYNFIVIQRSAYI